MDELLTFVFNLASVVFKIALVILFVKVAAVVGLTIFASFVVS